MSKTEYMIKANRNKKETETEVEVTEDRIYWTEKFLETNKCWSCQSKAEGYLFQQKAKLQSLVN